MLGQKFNLLTVIGGPEKRNYKRYWTCLCDCGNVSVVMEWRVVTGWTTSCGCRSGGPKENADHKHPLYDTWCSMRTRCNSPNHKNYMRYGGRGIVVCDRWNASFASFVADVGERPGPGYSIDRIDNDGNYEPGNVRWATSTEQATNKGKPVSRSKIAHDGITDTYAGWANRLGVTRKRLWQWLNLGKSMERFIQRIEGRCP